MSRFNLVAPYSPAGDQPKAIKSLTDGLQSGLKNQTLLGVTGSGKTYTIANVIANVQKPTLVIAHNKTLAAQLCQEFREFFPDNAVEYFVSYYDYYQPEAYMPRTDTYIEKEAQINDEIDRLRHSATQAILTRRDVIIVASVSCIYALGSPEEYLRGVIHIKKDQLINRQDLMRQLVELQFVRTTVDLVRGQFRVRGDVLEVMPVNEEVIYRLVLDGEKIAELSVLDSITRRVKNQPFDIWIFPAKHYVTPPESQKRAIERIEIELKNRLEELEKEGKVLEYERLNRRTRYDLEMIRNIGYCNGIENYSSFFDGRAPGEPPYSLVDYFPEDFLTIVDESHVSIPQIGGMYAGDQARKNTLIEHGFRLPSARDNRPLKFNEFEDRVGQAIFVSATPGPYERQNSRQVIEQIIRPTGLVDPETLLLPVVSVKKSDLQNWYDAVVDSDLNEQYHSITDRDYPGQIQDFIARVKERIAVGERALATTLTKKMAEDLAQYLKDEGFKVAYLHSDVETLERITILTDLRKGVYDCLVGVNLLREGLDLPEVSLIGILDADKEGFLRSETSLIQTIGRAARNINGLVVLYADQMTGSLARALSETKRRRTIQLQWNLDHNITPKSISKKIGDIRALLGDDGVDEARAEKIIHIEHFASPKEIKLLIAEKKAEMSAAAANLMFETAAALRDEIIMLEKELMTTKGKSAAKSAKKK